jgi:intermediate cleaving peptidase 55
LFYLSKYQFIFFKARTYPASGTFSGPQRELYSAVLFAQKELINLCSAQAGWSLHALHRKSCELLCQALNQIGFDIGNDLERELYPHYLTHSIGIGVSSPFLSLVVFKHSVDLHESTHIDRFAPSAIISLCT